MDKTGRRLVLSAAGAALALVIAAVALLWSASEAHYRGCVEQTAARYPPIAVSAFSGAQTGPLKVAYDKERSAALEGCSRAPW